MVSNQWSVFMIEIIIFFLLFKYRSFNMNDRMGFRGHFFSISMHNTGTYWFLVTGDWSPTLLIHFQYLQISKSSNLRNATPIPFVTLSICVIKGTQEKQTAKTSKKKPEEKRKPKIAIIISYSKRLFSISFRFVSKFLVWSLNLNSFHLHIVVWWMYGMLMMMAPPNKRNSNFNFKNICLVYDHCMAVYCRSQYN